MSNWLSGLFDRAFAVGGALIFAQTPMFIQQYGHQLSGRVAELKLQIDAIANSALLGQKSLQQYIQRFIDSGDADFRRQGELMHLMTERYESLAEAMQTLTTASPLIKPWVFMRDFNWDIARMTFADFQPGVPFTLEGIMYAIMGIGVGYGIFFLITATLHFCYRSLLSLFVRRKVEIKNE